jgi:hypothetical protein
VGLIVLFRQPIMLRAGSRCWHTNTSAHVQPRRSGHSLRPLV